MSKLKRALVSVSDKSGIVEFARALAALGVQILSTGGTARLLEKEGVPVTEVSAHTGFPEMLDGRVKTLHPKIHGGILARRDSHEHMAAIAQAGIEPIDLIVVNLYPFQATVADPDCRLEDAIENIDIGGPAMLRSAAKNHAGVAVVVDPADYARVLAELHAAGEVSAATRFALAKKVFAHTAAYDGAIANYLSSLEGGARGEYPGVLNLQFAKLQDLRYGENPHQTAAFYRDAAARGGRARRLPAGPGQGTVLQQHRRRRRRLGMRQELRRAGLRHRQARQSLRRRARARRRSPRTARPSPPTRSPRSAASSPSTARSMLPPRRPSASSSPRW